jgi:hypothetical protein
MPILKKRTEHDPNLPTLKKKIVDEHYNWWERQSGENEADNLAKFEELVVKWNLNKKLSTIIWAAIIDDQYKTLRKWYLKDVETGSDFQHLINEIYADVAVIEVQNRLLTDLLKWKEEDDVKPRQPLKTFAKDKQNVHTSVVVTQQNQTIAFLKKVNIPKGQRALDEIITAWLPRWDPTTQMVVTDMKTWGRKSWIVEEGDYLYRDILVHLWAKIKTYEGSSTYQELVTRLFEECEESVGMCAMGHISRLCNVLAGYVEGIQSPMDSKETFQNEFALLAAREMDADEKMTAALDLLKLSGIPAEEWSAWTDAL